MPSRRLLILITTLSVCALTRGSHAFADASPVAPGIHVTLGMEQLFSEPYFKQIRNLRIGVLAHNASRNHDGTHLVDMLASRKDVQLKMIFSPEHGFRSADDTLLPDSTDPKTGLPVYSLYGPRKSPTPEMLNQIDAVVIDLQDVGMRFYTYAATMVYTMEACQRAGKRVIVLDRPNPLGGAVVEGAVLDETLVDGGYTTLAPIPTRHGMTMGELAVFYNQTLGIGTDVSVVPMQGWSRALLWTDTDLPWFAPSPALMTVEQTFLYSAFGPLENLNLAVGRGETNELAFHVYGAPWINEAQSELVLSSLDNLGLPGLRFSPAEWTPSRGIYANQLSRGFRVDTTEFAQTDSFLDMIDVMSTLERIFGNSLDFSKDTAELGASWLSNGIQSGKDPGTLVQEAEAGSSAFLKERERALIYQ